MFSVYNIEENEKWDRIVSSFKKHDVYYLRGYVKAFYLHGDGNPILIYYEDKNIRGINVVMKRDISKFELLSNEIEENTYYDFSTPYGYGGWIVEEKKDLLKGLESLNQNYTEWCIENNIISEFVRFNPVLENWENLDNIYEIIELGNTVYIDTSSEEIILKGITSKNRNVIRKAIKSGLKTYWTRDYRIIEPFINLYNLTMDKDEATDYYYFDKDFYESVLEDLKYNAMWFYTSLEDEIAAIAIIMFCNGKVHYHLSASDVKFRSYAATNLLLYEAAIWACKNGYKKLHLGGGVGSKEDSLYKFKKAFNRYEDLKFCIGKKIYSYEKYTDLVNYRKKSSLEINEKYFPVYRS